MKNRSSLLILTLFAIAACGINSVMFTELSHQMAATMGLSLDETGVVKIGFMIAQILGFLLIPLLVRNLGAYHSLVGAITIGLVTSILLYFQVPNLWLFSITWFCTGFAMSALIITLNLFLLDTFESRWLPALIAITLILSTLLPMGAYPWLVAQLIETFDWSLFCAISAWLYFSALVLVSLFKPKPLTLVTKVKSSYGIYVVLIALMSFVVYLLMRGSFYNWLDSIVFSQLTVVVATLVLLAAYLLVTNRDKNTATAQLFRKLETNVFMYNGFLAGFAVIASNALVSNFLKSVMHYNDLNAGYAQLPAFYAMLAGMLMSLLVCYSRCSLADVVVPFGVFMIILSVHGFSQLPNMVSPESLTLPMVLRGFGVGMLNVSVTIAVLLYFNEEQRLEGITNFYLFRTMGGIISGAFFSRVIQNHSAYAAGELGGSLDGTSSTFAAYENSIASAVLANGHLPSSSLGVSQISGVVKEQATTLALSNSLIMFIFSIFALAPVLLIGKKLVAKNRDK